MEGGEKEKGDRDEWGFTPSSSAARGDFLAGDRREKRAFLLPGSACEKSYSNTLFLSPLSSSTKKRERRKKKKITFEIRASME